MAPATTIRRNCLRSIYDISRTALAAGGEAPKPGASTLRLMFLMLALLLPAQRIAADEPGQDAPATEQESLSSQLQLKTEKMIVFKDGYVLVIRKGRGVTNERGELFTYEVPDSAVLGSFWAMPTAGRLTSMVAGWADDSKTVSREFTCTTPLELLQANLGRNVQLRLNTNREITGTVKEILGAGASQPVDEATLRAFDIGAATPSSPNIHSISHLMSQPAGSHFVLHVEQGDLVLPVHAVQDILAEELKTRITRTVTSTSRRKRLTFTMDEPGAAREITLMYFRPGVRWIPTYRVELAEADGKPLARIAMQAELLNEAEDVDDAPLDIVVGVPNFRFRTLPSPLILEHTLRNTLAQAAPQLMGQMRNDFSNALYTQRAGELRRDAAHANEVAGGGDVELPDSLTASGAQDLFVYQLPPLRIKRGERAAVPIFQATAPYRSVYTWDLTVQRHGVDAAPSGSGIQSPLALAQNEVWHQLELQNNTKAPWTTGAAMLMQGMQPLAQELLTYTSPGDFCRVPVTVSVETRGSYEEEEIGREPKALRWHSTDYMLIKKQGRLHLCNNKPEAIEVEITAKLAGRVTTASHDGEITLLPYNAQLWQNYQGHHEVNNSSIVRWKVRLAPGETFEPELEYQLYVR